MRSVIAPESARGGSPVASKLTDVLSVQKREIWSGLLIVGAASAVMAVFLSVYTLRHLAVPIGWDNADYVWRTRLAEVVGIRGIPSGVPAGTFVKQGRPAFLIVAATVSSLSGMSLLLLAMVLPAVTAASMGLASAALLGSASDLDWLDRAAVVLAVGLSINAVLMAEYGYVDNLMMVPVFLVGALAAMLAAEDRRALVGAIVLLGAAGLTHGALFTVAVAVLGLVALSYVPSSWRSWRSGQNLLDTPSMRLGEALAGGIAVAYAALVATASTAPAPRLSSAGVPSRSWATSPTG